MKKNKGLYITVIILESLLVVTLSAFLYIKWYKPYKEEKDLRDSINNISSKDVDNIISNLKNNEEITVPVINNDLINNTNWVNYGDNNVIAFKDGYFVWYTDSNLTSDNAMIGQFSYYEGKDAFNLIESSMNVQMDKTDNDSVLILNIISYKKDGEETLDSAHTKYLFGYRKDKLMSYVDILTLDNYSFLECE